MAKFDAAIGALNDATNALAIRIDAIIAGGTVSDTETIAKLTAISARLNTLAADQANPVPTEPPVTP